MLRFAFLFSKNERMIGVVETVYFENDTKGNQRGPVIRLANTAFHGDTETEREGEGETALIPAHSMKEKIPEYRSVPVARCGWRLSASAAHQPTHYPNYIPYEINK